jgi:Zn-dependent protease with chaperone function
MSGVTVKAARFAFVALLCTLRGSYVLTQQIFPPDRVPSNFTADAAFASRVRTLLLPTTNPATGQYAVGKEVMKRLIGQLPAGTANFSWDLRIAKDAGNVFSSPDGTIFVDEALAQTLGSQSGLWAAALSHEISHIVRRDWARRYLFQKSLEANSTSLIVLGDARAFSGSWTDARSSSTTLASFCQLMELEADAEGLMLMARAGFHPDFMPALHHLLQAEPREFDKLFLDHSHPGWDERDQSMQKFMAAAGREYDRQWPARYASPGGNPPIVVYAGSPSAKRDIGGDLQVLVPLHCQNLSGSVEVVLRLIANDSEFPSELRQFTGCTSIRTLIRFTLPNREPLKGSSRPQVEISVLDADGAVLTRSVASIPMH